ncbi:zinc-binding dehydrogenase [candidate division KSB1 bacterium]|nr:zinc-binding dehydrogenase [candidate division KSB1 bacterium]
MRAILIHKPASFELIEMEAPQPADDELLIQVKVTALCNQHDWKVNRGLYRDLIYLEYGIPGFPGHEGAGVVVEVGEKVTDFQIGDHVVMSGLGGPPLYAGYVTRKHNLVARVQAHFPLEQVAMAELIGCVHHACAKLPTYQDKRVAISGCGPGGLTALQLVKAYGAAEVLAIDIQPARLMLARQIGADTVIDARDVDAIEKLKQSGMPVVIECSGNKTAYQTAFQLARETVIIFGYSEGILEVPLWPLFDHELTIYNSKWLTNDDLLTVVNLIQAGKIRTAELITHRFDFAHYLDAVAKIGSGEVIKAVMVPGD